LYDDAARTCQRQIATKHRPSDRVTVGLGSFEG
jgi:hypothetical protein